MIKPTPKSILDKIASYKPGKPIKELKREQNLKQVFKLASNENPFSPSPKAQKAITRQISGINRYPDSECFYLRKKLRSTLRLDREEIVFGNGSDEIITLALRAFISPGKSQVIIGTINWKK